LNVGRERSLERLLRLGAPRESLRQWVAHRSHPSRDPPEFDIDAALFGDGSKS
jgi:hypothetical protein